MIGSAALMRRAVVEGVVYRDGIIGAASHHCIDWDGTQAHGWDMTSYENFMNRFFADLAIHYSAGRRGTAGAAEDQRRKRPWTAAHLPLGMSARGGC